MRSSNIVKKVLGNSETLEYRFSLSNRYLKLKMIIALLVASIFLGLAIFLVIVFNNFSAMNFSDNAMNDFNQGPLTETNFVSTDSNNLNLNLLFIMISGFLLIVVPIILFYYLYYLKISNEYIFTNQRVLIKRGWLNTKTTSVHYNRITDVSITQSFIDRLLKIGILSISTAGSEGYKVVLPHINSPHEIKKNLYDLKQKHQITTMNNSSHSQSTDSDY